MKLKIIDFNVEPIKKLDIGYELTINLDKTIDISITRCDNGDIFYDTKIKVPGTNIPLTVGFTSAFVLKDNENLFLCPNDGLFGKIKLDCIADDVFRIFDYINFSDNYDLKNAIAYWIADVVNSVFSGPIPSNEETVN